jgi:uncharacterized membrane protein YeaQ/YmgE (transglycosylase-associated protein family)
VKTKFIFSTLLFDLVAKVVKCKVVAAESYYDILGVKPKATNKEIKDAYFRLSKKIHPDMGGSNALFRTVKDAYETLSDPVRRSAYDVSISRGYNNTHKSDTYDTEAGWYDYPKTGGKENYRNGENFGPTQGFGRGQNIDDAQYFGIRNTWPKNGFHITFNSTSENLAREFIKKLIARSITRHPSATLFFAGMVALVLGSVVLSLISPQLANAVDDIALIVLVAALIGAIGGNYMRRHGYLIANPWRNFPKAVIMGIYAIVRVLILFAIHFLKAVEKK